MSFFGFDTSLPPLDKSELSKEKKSNVDQDLETFGLKENPILDDDEELNNETFGAAADVDKIDRNFDFTAGNSFFEKQIQGQDLGSKQLSGSSSFNNSSSSIDREQTFGIKNSNINKSASDMLNERIWNHYNSGNSNFSDETKNNEGTNSPFDYDKYKSIPLSQIESKMLLENHISNFSPLQMQQSIQMAKIGMDPKQLTPQQQFQQIQKQLQQQQFQQLQKQLQQQQQQQFHYHQIQQLQQLQQQQLQQQLQQQQLQQIQQQLQQVRFVNEIEQKQQQVPKPPKIDQHRVLNLEDLEASFRAQSLSNNIQNQVNNSQMPLSFSNTNDNMNLQAFIALQQQQIQQQHQLQLQQQQQQQQLQQQQQQLQQQQFQQMQQRQQQKQPQQNQQPFQQKPFQQKSLSQDGNQQFQNRMSNPKQNYNNRYNKQYQSNNNNYYYQKNQRNSNDFEKKEDEYSGLMTRKEKELIARIQISQLITDDPYSDDFYYQMFTEKKNNDKQGESKLNWQQTYLMKQGKGGNLSSQMQQQVQHLIDGRKQKPKNNQFSLEGALGKIALNSVRNPKQLLQVNKDKDASKKTLSNTSQPQQTTRLSHYRTLASIENVYTYILKLEQKERQKNLNREQNSDNELDNEEETEEEKHEREELINKIWNELKIKDEIPLDKPHPFVQFLSYSKGKKVIPRVLHFLSKEQSLAFLNLLLLRLNKLDVCSENADPVEVDLFINSVVPPLVNFLSEMPLCIINGCFGILLKCYSMTWMGKCKVALAILTVFLSRAEILRQDISSESVISPNIQNDLQQWSDLYDHLFNLLRNNFVSLFPENGSDQDDVCVWQFLAAIAISAQSIEYQKSLVMEVREKVFETIKDVDNEQGLVNVNLFLHALGIDASQI